MNKMLRNTNINVAYRLNERSAWISTFSDQLSASAGWQSAVIYMGGGRNGLHLPNPPLKGILTDKKQLTLKGMSMSSVAFSPHSLPAQPSAPVSIPIPPRMSFRGAVLSRLPYY